ncbi:MurR/RpiR family transcriptional regulator [Rhizobium rhizogenes]|jgi:DNA-binding MurR/RpiR family transcriptional regulator|uniref:MurR/RpiR family transcriptional regulator n=1 Tax=Rhizobium rhizogenes TaxID=359 RepID=UPI000A482394|nr:MurR/RpiR family transcriptional regulator [Rhizobium rhizogenes]NTF85420.1 MurR/RpiR family transcriptional regulator [Rhizobium rhizogenes]NTI31282.1 MurR/RpiR family transcriptional regulator [Rhizobium rhizogenes]
MARDRSDENRISQHHGGLAILSDKRNAQDIIGLIVDQQSQFSKTNQRIAQAILSEPHSFVEKSIEELTTWLGVSAPTVTRFSRMLGCDGLKDLKLKIMGSVRVGIRYLEPQTPPGSIAEVAERVTKRAQKTIADMHHNVDLERAQAVVDRISACHTLYAFGSGGVSSWLIEEIQNRFFRLGIRVIPCNDHQMQFMLATGVERTDVVICCSLTGANVELEKAIAVAREYGATTIALTPRSTSLAAAVDELLPIDSPPDEDILSPASIRYAYLIAIDIIAYGVAIARKDAGREKLRRLKQQLAIARDVAQTQPLCD